MKFGATWREPLGLPDCPYMYRWVLWLGWFSIRIHYWVASDDLEFPHDHPWWFITFVLWGYYVDFNYDSYRDRLRTSSIRFRKASYRHRVMVIKPTVTLLITGPETRTFGFWVKGKFIKASRYFRQIGHHPCQPDQPRIKTHQR